MATGLTLTAPAEAGEPANRAVFIQAPSHLRPRILFLAGREVRGDRLSHRIVNVDELLHVADRVLAVAETHDRRLGSLLVLTEHRFLVGGDHHARAADA